jgi:hypothetical protein
MRSLHRLLWTLLALSATSWAAAPVSEYQLKAVYLFNFGQFVEWPPEAFEAPEAPFVIGIVGEDPFGKTLEDLVRGQSLGPHPITVRRYRAADEITSCNILFIGRADARRLPATLAALRGRSILTVTDAAGGEQHGAVIVLVTENNRVRMRINLAAAKANNLVISSKLLRPAEVIGGG